MHWVPPILIHQMGKVGSESIQASFNRLHLPSIHSHFLSWQRLKDLENYYVKLPHAIIPQHIDRSKRLRAIIDETWGRIRWKIVTLVREPVARTISDVFQNLSFTMPYLASINENDAFKLISDYILAQFSCFDEKSDYICTWFDREVKDVFKLDIYGVEFNKSAGYQILNSENTDTLVIKLEKLSECHQPAFRDYLGIDNFQLLEANAGSQKPYRHLYKNLLECISIPKNFLERVYSSKFVKHFYTDEEIQRFKTRWSGHSAEGTGLNCCISEITPLESPVVKQKERDGLLQSNSVCNFNHQPVSRTTKAGNQPRLPTISLVTPSYNQGKYLDECIDSVLSQNYPNLEYVIMDGGSTDNSVEIIKKYEKHLTYWQSRYDEGQYSALNEGFSKTKGEIMTWLNSDDKFHPNAFFTVAGLFMLRHEVEWITGRTNILNEQGEQFWICEYLIPWERSKYLKKEFMDPWIQQEGTFWHRRLWEKSGSHLRSDLEFAGDLELWVRFFRHTQLYTTDTLLAGYRFQPNSKARLFMDKYIQEANGILDEEYRLFRDGVHQELLPPPEPIELDEIRQGLRLIRGLEPALRSFADMQSGWATLKDGHRSALEFYEDAVALHPDNASLHNSLGMLYWQDREVKKAIAEFVNALRIKSDYPDALLNLGDVLVRINADDKASKLYAAYLTTNPQDIDLLKSVASIKA